jgi:glycosyltransferase involved in cell wall biosynthesis
MIRVAHLVDDLNLGGVNRCLDAQLPMIDPEFAHSRLAVTPDRGLPPRVDAEIVVIHFTTSWRKLGWLAGLRLRNPKAALVLMEHSYTRAFEALHVANRTRFRRMLRLTYSLMDRVISVSNEQCKWLMEATSRPRQKFAVIRPFTEMELLRALPLPVRQPGPLRLCSLGRYTSQKGFDILIAAMRLVPHDVATLRLAGLGPDEESLRKQASDLPHVRIEGPVSGPAGLLCDCDAVAIPSRFEAFGCVAAEARAAARPVILSAVDGLVDQSVSSPELRVPPQDPTALAKAIIWLAQQDITVLGALARQSVDGMEAATIAAWNGLLRETAPHGRPMTAA